MELAARRPGHLGQPRHPALRRRRLRRPVPQLNRVTLAGDIPVDVHGTPSRVIAGDASHYSDVVTRYRWRLTVAVLQPVHLPATSRSAPDSRTAAGSASALAAFSGRANTRAPRRRLVARAAMAGRGRQRRRRGEQHLLFGDQRSGVCRPLDDRGLRLCLRSSGSSVPALVSSVVISFTPTAPMSRARLPRALIGENVGSAGY